MCGACGHERLSERPACHGSAEAREDRAAHRAGQDRDQVLAVLRRDSAARNVLDAPIDKGFNRLAWFLPYGSARPARSPSASWPCGGRAAGPGRDRPVRPTFNTAEDPVLETRLDDELRDLD